MIGRFITTLSVFFIVNLVSSQNISLDTTFGTDGYQFEYGVFSGNYITSAILLPNNQTLVAGTKNASNQFYISKYNTDGSFDTTFGTNGYGSTTISSINNQKEAIYKIALQQDGKIIVAGQSDIDPSLSGYYYNALLARFNADGSIDTSFGDNGFVKTDLGSNEDYISDIYITSSTHIYAVSHSTESDSGNNTAQVLKYDVNGNLDTNFGSNGIENIALDNNINLTSIFVQSDDSIILSGSLIGVTNDKDFLLAKLNSNGSFDTSFGTNGLVITDFGYLNESINEFVITDTKIIAVGTISSTDFLPHIGIASYNFDGSLDTNFSTDGKLIESPDHSNYNTCFGTDINIMPNGNLLVSGNAIGNNNYDLLLTAYHINGTRDSSFATNGQFLHQNSTLQEFSNDVLIQANGKILSVGVKTSSANTSPQTMLVRFKDAYTLNTDSFELDSPLVLYPNPTRDIVWISTKKDIKKIAIYSISGQIIKEIEGSKTFSTSFLNPGVYLVKITNEHKSYFSKIVKL
ncbi:T9SS type A sorting domain-containing protein [Bizionia arctica]|uniref:Secretion system C-terminal sorting domain-containing protein n=1 Tax=Bizionia arctica TaxID=1495645 RepID=A0A917GSD0_9FLAO|nr:T9SS type A sorting domain-containing protein [Bizionia arctica]GGG56002.1 hypothetical protein GCM10010976_28540 [Bizionia arctica]